jgi:hypothetical protein
MLKCRTDDHVVIIFDVYAENSDLETRHYAVSRYTGKAFSKFEGNTALRNFSA